MTFKIGISKDINERLKDHRSTAPCCLLKYLIYTSNNKLLESMVKHKLRNQIDPTGSEVIATDLEQVISATREAAIYMDSAYDEASPELIAKYNLSVPE